MCQVVPLKKFFWDREAKQLERYFLSHPTVGPRRFDDVVADNPLRCDALEGEEATSVDLHRLLANYHRIADKRILRVEADVLAKGRHQTPGDNLAIGATASESLNYCADVVFEFVEGKLNAANYCSDLLHKIPSLKECLPA